MKSAALLHALSAMLMGGAMVSALLYGSVAFAGVATVLQIALAARNLIRLRNDIRLL